MREIKFRGIREEYNPAWHQSIFRFGNLLNNNSIGEVGCDLSHYEYAKVKPETIGQYTGLKDKNGNEIYEGDICKVQLPLGGFWGNVKKEKIGVVEYNEDVCGFVIRWEWSKNQHHIQIDCDLEIEVIGNINEKPELLKP
jgi:uncharacterized phage protein (TIGR01671 family)